MSNYSRNRQAIEEFRRELQSYFEDISEIDKRVLNKAVDGGLAQTKTNTPVKTGALREEWFRTPVSKQGKSVVAEIYNNMEYAPHVEYGHRVVNKDGATVGYVVGRNMLQKGVYFTEEILKREFEKELRAVRGRHES